MITYHNDVHNVNASRDVVGEQENCLFISCVSVSQSLYRPSDGQGPPPCTTNSLSVMGYCIVCGRHTSPCRTFLPTLYLPYAIDLFVYVCYFLYHLSVPYVAYCRRIWSFLTARQVFLHLVLPLSSVRHGICYLHLLLNFTVANVQWCNLYVRKLGTYGHFFRAYWVHLYNLNVAQNVHTDGGEYQTPEPQHSLLSRRQMRLLSRLV